MNDCITTTKRSTTKPCAYFLGYTVCGGGPRLCSGGSRENHSHWATSQCSLTHWGRVTHICVSKLIIIGLDNGLSPGRRQAIIWTNAGILLIRPLGINFREILIEIYTFSFKKKHLKVSSAKWRPFCLSLKELIITEQSQAWCNAVEAAGQQPLTH